MLLQGIWSRNDAGIDINLLVCLAAMGNLGSVSGTKFLAAGEWDSRQAF
jgi:hypothetical protein